MKTAVVFLADGLEECEGLIVVDLLRRAGVNVITASVTGKREVTSSHNITFLADALAEEVDFAATDMIVLPGGMPGTTNLAESRIVQEQCRAFAKAGGVAGEELISEAVNGGTGEGLAYKVVGGATDEQESEGLVCGDKKLAAICAAPSVLAGLGLLEGKAATCHPGFADKMAGACLTGGPVAVSGNIITGQGLGAAIPFALELVRQLVDAKTADRIADGICYRG